MIFDICIVSCSDPMKGFATKSNLTRDLRALSEYFSSISMLLVLACCFLFLSSGAQSSNSTDHHEGENHSPLIFRTVKSANKNGTVDYGYYIETRPKTLSWLRPLVFGVTVLGSERRQSDQSGSDEKCLNPRR